MLKETILQKSFAQHLPDENEFKEFLKRSVTYIDDIADLPAATREYLDQAYNSQGITYICEEVTTGVYDWVAYDQTGTQLEYPDLSNKPQINSVTITGNSTGDTLKLLSNFSILETGSDPLSLTSLLATEDAGDTSISVKRTVQDLYDLFNIANLPKYEKQFNPLLIASGGSVMWTITYTLKTNTPIIQLFDKNGELQDSNNLTGLVIVSRVAGDITISFTSASNVAANEYYVVLIG